jgi:predicted hydrocarbon binding protein
MITTKFRIVSDQREGLLVQIGRVIAGLDFTILRPRVERTESGAILTVIVRGPGANLLALQDRLSSHPMVQSFEAAEADESAVENVAVAPVSHRTPPAQPVVSATVSAGTDKQQVEALLSALAASYPSVQEPVIAFTRNTHESQRKTKLHYVGTRLGAWIYKRDFRLGARLSLSDSITKIVQPALRQMLRGVEVHDDVLQVASSPYVGTSAHRDPSCHFLCGCIEGLLNEPGHLGRIQVTESSCRNSGAQVCSFVISN